MKKLYALSDAQRTKLSEWAQQWIAIGLSTEPADRPTFERAVGMLYVEQGRKAPSVIWTGSPLAVDLVMMHLTSNAATPEFDLSFLPRCVVEHVREVVRVETGSRVVYGTLEQLQSTTTKRRYFHGPFHAGGWWTLSGRCAARYGSPATASFLQDVCGIEPSNAAGSRKSRSKCADLRKRFRVLNRLEIFDSIIRAFLAVNIL